jgi:hypothetical protein
MSLLSAAKVSERACSDVVLMHRNLLPVLLLLLQSAFYEKVPAGGGGGCRLWCGTGGMCTGG